MEWRRKILGRACYRVRKRGIVREEMLIAWVSLEISGEERVPLGERILWARDPVQAEGSCAVCYVSLFFDSENGHALRRCRDLEHLSFVSRLDLLPNQPGRISHLQQLGSSGVRGFPLCFPDGQRVRVFGVNDRHVQPASSCHVQCLILPFTPR